MKISKLTLIMIALTGIVNPQNQSGFQGYISIPSSESFRDGSLIFSSNYINKENTSYREGANNIYSLAATFVYLPNLELAVRLTRPIGFDSQKLGLGDRSFGLKYTLDLKQKYLPRLLVCINDPYRILDDDSGNASLNYFFIMMGKQIEFTDLLLSFDIGYSSHLGISSNNYFKQNIAGGISIVYLDKYFILAEYDTKNFNYGFRTKILKNFYIQTSLMKSKFFAGGLSFLFKL